MVQLPQVQLPQAQLPQAQLPRAQLPQLGGPPGAQLALLLVPQASSQLLGKVFPETPTGSTKLVKANIWHF